MRSMVGLGLEGHEIGTEEPEPGPWLLWLFNTDPDPGGASSGQLVLSVSVVKYLKLRTLQPPKVVRPGQ